MTPNENCLCPRAKHFHGTPLNYQTHGCRCNECRDAVHTKSATDYRLKAYGRYDRRRVDAQPARDHINKLRAQGIGARTISEQTGLSKRTISCLLYGEPARNLPPTRTIAPTTAAKILNTKYTLTGGHQIDPTGTRRRIQALAAIGYPFRQQSRMAGIRDEGISKIHRNKYVTHETAQKIAALYDRLQLKPAPTSNSAIRARTTARRNGWLPPLAWDEDRIDDPNHTGYPEAVAA